MDPAARWICIAYGVAYLVAVVCVGVGKLWERRRRPAAVEHVAETGGFWDYLPDPTTAGSLLVVVVDQDGAGRLPCASTPGDQLRHLTCPLAGPCTFDRQAVQ